MLVTTMSKVLTFESATRTSFMRSAPGPSAESPRAETAGQMGMSLSREPRARRTGSSRPCKRGTRKPQARRGTGRRSRCRSWRPHRCPHGVDRSPVEVSGANRLPDAAAIEERAHTPVEPAEIERDALVYELVVELAQRIER